jgi:hypothetical protein
LAYLGKDDAMHHSENLRREMNLVQNLNFNDIEWIDFQLKFLKAHDFFTRYARKHIIPGKEKYIKNLLIKKASIEEEANGRAIK